jgi:hypothetical protein
MYIGIEMLHFADVKSRGISLTLPLQGYNECNRDESVAPSP